MATDTLEAEVASRTLFDAVAANAVILNQQGDILAVNEAWKRFAVENGDPGLLETGVGINYLDVCHKARGPFSEEAVECATRLEAVLSGESSEFTLEYPCHSPDEKRWFLMRAKRLNDQGEVFITHFNITRFERNEALQAGQNQALELLATDGDLREILQRLVVTMDGQIDGVISSVLLLDSDGKRLRHAAGLNLPREYIIAIDGTEIGPAVGSCGTAAFEGLPVIVEDIQKDPLWTNYKELAKKYNLGACWSLPIISSAGKVLGTFANYYRQPRRPSNHELELMRSAVHLASVAIERKRANQSLRESEERFRDLFENAHDLIQIVSPNGKLQFVNRAWREALGYSKEEIVELSMFDFIHPASLEHCQSLFQKLCAGKNIGTVEAVFVGKGTRNIHVEGKCSARRVEGNLVSVRGIFRDVTAQKAAEERSKSILQLLQAITEGTTDAIFVKDLQGRYEMINSAGARMLGKSPSEVIGKKDFQLFEPESARKIMERDQKLLASGELQTYEEVGTAMDHTHTFLSTKWPRRDAEGNITGLLGISRDITQRKEAEARLRVKDQAIESAVVGIAFADLKGLITYVNPAFARLFGYATCDELLGCSAMNFSAIPERATEIIRSAIQEGFWQGEDEGRRKDGTAFFLELTVTPILDEIGKPAAVMATFNDITQRKEAETKVLKLNSELTGYANQLEERVARRTRELAVARDRAEAADRMKSAFLATMSHELRTPLNSIIGFTGIMLQGLAGPLNEEQAKQMKLVQSSARHLLNLINDVLDISKIEAGELEISPLPFDVPEAIVKSIAILKPLAEQKGLKLTVQVAPEVGFITSDCRRFEQVLVNLVSNAIKFTSQGSVRVECRLNGEWIETRITDTGIGIQGEEMDKLFHPFQQIESGTTRQHEGTGLGLAISKKLVKMLGGKIWAESQWGVGSTFTFSLPIHLQEDRT